MRLNQDLTPEEFRKSAHGGITALEEQLEALERDLDMTTFKVVTLIDECQEILQQMRGSIDGI